MAYATQLVKDVTGFIGWLPYDIIQWDLSQNKLLAKAFFKSKNILFPAEWKNTKNITSDFVIKSKGGSFGYQVSGPYRDSDDFSLNAHDASTSNISNAGFAEQFIEGVNLKVWFWGVKAIYAQHHNYPSVIGDGIQSIHTLIESRLAKAGIVNVADSDQKNMAAALRFQRLQHADIPYQGCEVWLDFRYGRRYMPATLDAETDSDLDQLSLELTKQIDEVGDAVGQEALHRFKTPMLYSVDGVVDTTGQVWWLEINSNPMLPPEAYPHMFRSLFSLSEKQAA